MRIFSKFRDYYDKVQAFGADDSVVYIRNPEYTDDCGIDLQDIESYMNKYSWRKSTPIHQVQRGAIIFCGKVYRFIEVHCGKEENTIYPSTIVYDYKSMVDALRKYYEETNEEKSNELFKKNISYYPDEDFFKVIDSNLNIERKCPIIYQNSGKLWEGFNQTEYTSLMNPFLKDFDFYKVKDAFTAYMELDMYMSGVLGNIGNPMVNISDMDKVYKHGFDPKYGFRTRKI